jgi:hypothetical protein
MDKIEPGVEITKVKQDPRVIDSVTNLTDKWIEVI